MNRDNDLRDLCAHWYEDDGVDFRKERRPERRESDPHRAARLCSAVHGIIDRSLRQASDAGDFFEVEVISVTAHEGTGCLRVAVVFPEASSVREVERCLARVRGLIGSLRAELAIHLVRKRVPELVVQLASPEEVDDGE